MGDVINLADRKPADVTVQVTIEYKGGLFHFNASGSGSELDDQKALTDFMMKAFWSYCSHVMAERRPPPKPEPPEPPAPNGFLGWIRSQFNGTREP